MYKFKLFCTVLLFSCGLLARPAEALLGDEMELVRYFYVTQKRWTAEQAQQIKKFSAVRIKMKPTRLHLYTDKNGLIEREIWASAFPMWTMSEAFSIRDAIMQKYKLVGGYSPNIDKIVYLYQDGSQVVFSVSKGRVYRVIAMNTNIPLLEPPKGIPPELRKLVNFIPTTKIKKSKLIETSQLRKLR